VGGAPGNEHCGLLASKAPAVLPPCRGQHALGCAPPHIMPPKAHHNKGCLHLRRSCTLQPPTSWLSRCQATHRMWRRCGRCWRRWALRVRCAGLHCGLSKGVCRCRRMPALQKRACTQRRIHFEPAGLPPARCRRRSWSGRRCGWPTMPTATAGAQPHSIKQWTATARRWWWRRQVGRCCPPACMGWCGCLCAGKRPPSAAFRPRYAFSNWLFPAACRGRCTDWRLQPAGELACGGKQLHGTAKTGSASAAACPGFPFC